MRSTLKPSVCSNPNEVEIDKEAFHMTVTDALETILAGRIVEFPFHGASYLIQQENNKGYNYLSIWRTAPDYVCLDRVFFDIEDGLDEGTVLELLGRKCIEGKSAADILTHGYKERRSK